VLSFFKSNNPGVVAFYLFYLAAFRLVFLFTSPDLSFTQIYHEPLSSFLVGGFTADIFLTPWVSTSAAALLVFVQSLFVNRIINEQRMTAKKNFLAGLLYIMLTSFFMQGLVLSPALIALTFIIIACETAFRLIKKEKMYGDIFDIGFLVSLASFFYFPAIALLLFSLACLINLRSFNYREFVVLLLGLATPFFLLFTYYYWNDDLPQMLISVTNHYERGWFLNFNPHKIEWMQIGFILALSVVLLGVVPGVVYASLIQVRKFVAILMFLLVIILASFFLQQQVSLSHLVWLAFPLSIFLTMVIMQWKRKMIGEVMHIILFLLIVAGQFLPLFFSI
jgi:hypothetical protein